MKYRQTLLLDSSYLPKNVIDSGRAFVIFMKGNCEIVKHYPKKFGLVRKDVDIYKPAVIRIKEYINIDYHSVPLNRDNIFKRDNHECVYCGRRDLDKKSLTIDHVIPQSHGGPNTWENLVTACKKCNGEKSNLTLLEYGKAIPSPKRPHYLMLMKKVDYIPNEWKDYLFF